MRDPCAMPLVALRADETCPRCGHPAREHRAHPSYQEEETMTEPTREQIEEWLYTHFAPASIDDERAVLRMALRTLDAEAQLRETKRERDVAIRDAAFFRNARDREIEYRLRDESKRDEVRIELAAMTERAEKAERERGATSTALNDLASGLRDVLNGFAMVGEKWTDAIKRLRKQLAEVERERDEEGRLCAERGVLYTNMVRQRDDWHGVAHAAAERAAVSNGLREAAEAERDALRAKLADAERERDEARGDLESMTGLYNTAWPALDSARDERNALRAKLAERDRYIADQRAITEPSVQDLARQLREATERAEKVESALRDLKPWHDQVMARHAEIRDVEAQLAAMTRRAEEAEAKLESSRQVEACSKAFHDLVVKERDFERVRAARLEEERDVARVKIAAMTERAELAEATVARMQHLHRTKPDEALDRATIRRVAEDDGLVHSADVLRLLADVEKAERERDVSRSALNSIVSELRDALGDFPMVGEKWTDAVKRLRARLADAERLLAEVKRKRDAASFDAEAQKFRARAVEERLAEVERERDEAASEAAAHNAAATQYEKDIADLRAKFADAERRIAELSPTTKDACLDTALTEK